MAATSLLSAKSAGALGPVARVRIAIILVALVAWEALAASVVRSNSVVR